MIAAILAFLAFWWQPIGFALVMTFFVLYMVHAGRVDKAWRNHPDTIAAQQKADYERAHAYKPDEREDKNV